MSEFCCWWGNVFMWDFQLCQTLSIVGQDWNWGSLTLLCETSGRSHWIGLAGRSCCSKTQLCWHAPQLRLKTVSSLTLFDEAFLVCHWNYHQVEVPRLAVRIDLRLVRASWIFFYGCVCICIFGSCDKYQLWLTILIMDWQGWVLMYWADTEVAQGFPKATASNATAQCQTNPSLHVRPTQNYTEKRYIQLFSVFTQLNRTVSWLMTVPQDSCNATKCCNEAKRATQYKPLQHNATRWSEP